MTTAVVLATVAARPALVAAATVVALALVAGKPGAHGRKFLARGHTAFFLVFARLGFVRPGHVAVDVAAGAALALAAGAAGAVVADAVEGGQFARLVVVAAGPGAGGLALVGLVLGHATLGPALTQHWRQGQHGLRVAESGFLAQRLDRGLVERLGLAAAQGARQLDAAVADALEAADQEALGIPEAPHFAVAAFADGDAEPTVAAAFADQFDRVETRRAVVQVDAGFQLLEGFVRHFAVYAAQVFALDAGAGVHQRVGQVAVGGQQQQARGVHVQATDGHPAAAADPRQLLEHGGAALGVLARDQLAFRLDVDEHVGVLARLGGDHERMLVQGHAIAGTDAGSDFGHRAVDADFAVGDALLEHATRALAGVGKHLVQAFAQGFGGVCRLALEGKQGFVLRGHARFSSGGSRSASAGSESVSVGDVSAGVAASGSAWSPASPDDAVADAGSTSSSVETGASVVVPASSAGASVVSGAAASAPSSASFA